MPAVYRTQSEVLKTLDWRDEKSKVLYWQVSPLSFRLKRGRLDRRSRPVRAHATLGIPLAGGLTWDSRRRCLPAYQTSVPPGVILPTS